MHLFMQLIQLIVAVVPLYKSKNTFIKRRILVDKNSILVHGEEVVLQLLLPSVFKVAMQASDQIRTIELVSSLKRSKRFLLCRAGAISTYSLADYIANSQVTLQKVRRMLQNRIFTI